MTRPASTRPRSRRVLRIAWVLGVAALVLAAASFARADAARVIDVADLRGGVPLTPYLSSFEDPDGLSDFAQIRAARLDRDVKVSARGQPSYGFTDSTLWLKLEIANSSDKSRVSVLDLAYPLLDHVTLYTEHADGRVETRTTGDALPFPQRDVDYTNFAFRLEAAPHTRTSYYLKLRSSGSLTVPLTLWEPVAFAEHVARHETVLWMYYGALLVLMLYNLGVWLMIRQQEYLAYVGMLGALLALSFSLSGHTAQYLLPTTPSLVNHALPLALPLVMMTAWRFVQLILVRAGFPVHARFAGYLVLPSALLMLAVIVVPSRIALRMALGGVLVGGLVGAIHIATLMPKRSATLRLYLASWSPLIVVIPVQVMRQANLLPPSIFTDWAAHIGIAFHGVITSLALALRVNHMRDQLASNVSELEGALRRAEDASAEARRATLAKDEFVATMSHELRTPLNAIINVPQGLLDDFTQQPSARCRGCDARFLLEPGEQLDPRVACPDCAALGTLEAGVSPRYHGEPERTMHFLRRIERSGRHLLQMVNGVLDFSKIEAGHLTLQPMHTDLGALLREVIDEFADLAAKKKLRITLAPPPRALPTVADPTRVKQILINVLANAVKFTEEGRTITVRWRALPEADIVAVQDQGIGIAPADHERVFQRFEQVHKGDTRKYGGTGLGLPISRSLARMHGGDLTVESAPGAGSTFTLTLPRRTAPMRRESTRNPDAAE